MSQLRMKKSQKFAGDVAPLDTEMVCKKRIDGMQEWEANDAVRQPARQRRGPANEEVNLRKHDRLRRGEDVAINTITQPSFASSRVGQHERNIGSNQKAQSSYEIVL